MSILIFSLFHSFKDTPKRAKPVSATLGAVPLKLAAQGGRNILVFHFRGKVSQNGIKKQKMGFWNNGFGILF
jgi:hypothetical protein